MNTVTSIFAFIGVLAVAHWLYVIIYDFIEIRNWRKGNEITGLYNLQKKAPPPPAPKPSNPEKK